MPEGGTRPPLAALVDEGRGGILLFGITPPKASTPAVDRVRIAERTLERLAPLDLDGLILYDIDDESDRIAEARPFPYLPTVDPADFYTEHLGAWTKPVVVYRSVG
ncbi:MAG TPA: 5,10-methylenetetrahydrofolate reductase, partial [Microlunatus sp.]